MNDEIKGQAGSAEPSANVLLKAILAVLLDERESRLSGEPDYIKPELLLASAGMSYQAIAQVLGKNPDAVRMMIARSRKTSGTSKPTASRKKAASDA